MVGEVDSTSGQVTGTHGNHDYWVVKMDSNGTCNGKRHWAAPEKMMVQKCCKLLMEVTLLPELHPQQMAM